VFGFMVPEYFVSDEMATKAWLPLPSARDGIVGGHAVVAVGYSNTASNPYMWVRNSWGPNWGNKGYYKMPFSWFNDSRRLVDDMWTVHPAV
jgi:C1A family cysteine protease